jgi:hypothetical protein
MNRTRNSLEMKETVESGSWPQLTSNLWRCSLSMNRKVGRVSPSTPPPVPANGAMDYYR